MLLTMLHRIKTVKYTRSKFQYWSKFNQFRPLYFFENNFKEWIPFSMFQTVSRPILPLPISKLNNFDFHNYICSKNMHTTYQNCFPKCDLTPDRYSVERGNYNKIEERDLQFFRSLLDQHRILTNTEELEGYNTDWLGMVRGSSSIVLKPKTTQEVSAILKYCNERCLAVCPQGGNTGLVGGSVPVFDEVVVSTSLMNEVEKVDKLTGIVVCQAGVVLEALDEHLSSFGLMMPLDLGSKGSCQIGGNVSTNAGGLRLLRYGSLHSTVLGVEAVLPSGEIIDCLTSLKKDNTGYDLKQLFIGSEGTLGLVTRVSIACPPRPLAVNLAFLGLSSFDNVLKTFQEAKAKLGEILSSCEMIDESSMDCVVSNLKLKPPIGKHKFYMVIETSGSNVSHDEEKMNSFLEHILSSEIVNDGTVATEPSKMLNIWAVRERIAESLLHDGYCYKYDISLPLPEFYRIVENMREKLGDQVVRCTGYGHVGDGNLHLNVTTKQFEMNVLDLIEPHLFELVASYRGSVSAEHGMGFRKKNFMKYSKSSKAIEIMKQLKLVFDPKGILNPYKVLPEE